MRKKFLSEPPWIAMISTAISGLAIHLFCLINIIHNHDNITLLPTGYGSGAVSGRWLLHILGYFDIKIMGCYNLPWLNGIIAILLLAPSAYLLIDVFQVRRRSFVIPLSIGFAAFPSVVSCLLFRFTVAYYFFAVLLAIAAAYVLVKSERFEKKVKIFSFIFSGILSSCSMGIYQAYFPITTTILVLYLIQQAMLGEKTWQALILQGIYFLASLILGLILYFLASKFLLFVLGVDLLPYQGIDKMGQIDILELPRLIADAFAGYFTMPINNTYMLAPTALHIYIYFFWNILSVSMVIVNFVLKKSKPIQWIITLAFYFCLPISINLLVIMCPGSYIYTLMVHAFVMMLFVPVVTFEAFCKNSFLKSLRFQRLGATIICLSLSLVAYMYTYIANVSYTAAYYATQQSENLANSIVTQVRMTEGFDPDQKWAFIGKCQDPLMTFAWQEAPIYQGLADTQRMTRPDLLPSWIKIYVGYNIDIVNEQEINQLTELECVQEMPVWPAYGSIEIIDDIVVIKFSD